LLAGGLTVPAAANPRRRVRPYLVSLERSRDRWKGRAARSRAEARALRRQLRRLAASRDRWRDEALASRRQGRPGPPAGKNARGP
jgi:hypothetical protein